MFVFPAPFYPAVSLTDIGDHLEVLVLHLLAIAEPPGGHGDDVRVVPGLGLAVHDVLVVVIVLRLLIGFKPVPGSLVDLKKVNRFYQMEIFSVELFLPYC